MLVGRRHVPGQPRSVAWFLSAQERRAFSRLTPEYLAGEFESVWAAHD